MRVTMTATYEDLWWEQECSECGETVTHVDGATLDYRGPEYHGGGYVCPEHGLRTFAQYDTAHDECREGGYTNPRNPWGGFRSPMPDTPEEAGYADWDAWTAENVSTVEFDSLWEAARFVLDFPGGVWDYREGEWSDLWGDAAAVKEGRQREVTLHVKEHAGAVFTFAERIVAYTFSDDDDMAEEAARIEYRIDRDASMVPLPLP